MALALAPPIRPSSSSAIGTGPDGSEASLRPQRLSDASKQCHSLDTIDRSSTFGAATSSLPPSRSSRFQSLGEQLLVPKTGGMSSSTSGPLPSVEGLSSHGDRSKVMVVSDSPDKSGGLPPMKGSGLSNKASLSRPASTASLPFVPNAMGLTGNRKTPSTTNLLGEREDPLLKNNRGRLNSKGGVTGELADSLREQTGRPARSPPPNGSPSLAPLGQPPSSPSMHPTLAPLGAQIMAPSSSSPSVFPSAPSSLAPLAPAHHSPLPPAAGGSSLFAAAESEVGLPSTLPSASMSPYGKSSQNAKPMQKADLIKELSELGLSHSEASMVAGRCAPCTVEAAVQWHIEHSVAGAAGAADKNGNGLHLPQVGGGGQGTSSKSDDADDDYTLQRKPSILD